VCSRLQNKGEKREGRKEGRKEGKKEGRKERRKEGRKEGRKGREGEKKSLRSRPTLKKNLFFTYCVRVVKDEKTQ
jgi:predicted transposase YdaD